MGQFGSSANGVVEATLPPAHREHAWDAALGADSQRSGEPTEGAIGKAMMMTKSSTNRYVAFLRGINVGGKHIVPMKVLAEIFAQAGCEQVQTYIQSGNVIFNATPMVVATIAEAMGKGIRKRFGHEAPVVVRSAEQLRLIVANNPFAKRKDFANFSHVVFCSCTPTPANVKNLNPSRSPGDEFECHGQEVYLWLPNGAGKSKLTSAYLDKTLETTGTQRNWRTVMKLSAML